MQTPWSGSKVIFEGVVIVSSILLAFAIDAWWDGMREAAERTRLVEAMYEDFTSTRTRLDGALQTERALLERTRTFLDLVADSDLRDSIPLDSLAFLLGGARVNASFQPSLASYQAAVNSGRIGLIEDAELFDAITEFELGLERFRETDALFGNIYYRGAIWELRRELGGLRVLGQDSNNSHPPEFQRSDHEMRAFLASPLAFSAVENVNQIHVNFMRGLCQMHDAAGEVLDALGGMRDPGGSTHVVDSPEECTTTFRILR